MNGRNRSAPAFSAPTAHPSTHVPHSPLPRYGGNLLPHPLVATASIRPVGPLQRRPRRLWGCPDTVRRRIDFGPGAPWAGELPRELPGHGLQIPVLRGAPRTPYPSPTFFVEVPRRAVAVGPWEDAPPASPSGRSARSLRYAIAGRAVAGCRRCRCRAGGAPCPPGTRGRQVAIWQAAAHGAGRGGLARRTLALRAVRQSDSSCCARSDTNRLKRYVPRSGCRRGAR